MSRLRCLELRTFHPSGVPAAACLLTRLEVLILLSPTPKHHMPGQGDPYPLSNHGVGALVQLRELRVSYHFNPVQELASPTLEVLEIEVHPDLDHDRHPGRDSQHSPSLSASTLAHRPGAKTACQTPRRMAIKRLSRPQHSTRCAAMPNVLIRELGLSWISLVTAMLLASAVLPS